MKFGFAGRASANTCKRSGSPASFGDLSTACRCDGESSRRRRTAWSFPARGTGTTFAARARFVTKIRLKNGVGAPKSWQADATATTRFKTSLSVAGGEVRGPLRVDVQQIVGQVGKTQIGGDSLPSRTLSKDESHRTADVTGVVQARKVGLSSKQYHTDDWWAEFKIDSAHVDTRQNLDMAGKVRARFRDGLPALNVLASQEEIPSGSPASCLSKGITLDLGVERFAGGATCSPRRERRALFWRGPPPIGARRDARRRSCFRLASLGFVSVGLDFVEDYSNMSPLVGETWLEEHLAPMTRAATDRHDAVCQTEPPKCQ